MPSQAPARGRRIPAPPPTPVPPPILRAMEDYQRNLVTHLSTISVLPTTDEVICETMAAARMAALSGNLDTAIKGFKAVGDLMGMGAVAPTHNHLHLHQTAANMLDADDGALVDLIAAAKAKPVAAIPAAPRTSCTTDSDIQRAHAAEALLV